MIFLFSVAAVELLVLGMGIAFLVWARRNQGAGHFLAMTFGPLITVLALIGILCTIYHGISHRGMGYYSHPMSSEMNMRQGDMNGPGMMKDGMMKDNKGMDMPNREHMMMPGMGGDSSKNGSSEEMKHEH